MTGMPALKPKEVIAILEKSGYYIDHTTGSHYICDNATTPIVSQFLIMPKTSRKMFYTQ